MLSCCAKIDSASVVSQNSEQKKMRFTGKNCVVTGGTSGIGLAAAKRLSDEGAKVLVTGTNEGRLKEAEGLGFVALKNDAGKAEDAEALAKAVEAKLGKVDCLFLNAGFGHFEAVAEASVKEFDAMFDVNVYFPPASVEKEGNSIASSVLLLHAGCCCLSFVTGPIE